MLSDREIKTRNDFPKVPDFNKSYERLAAVRNKSTEVFKNFKQKQSKAARHRQSMSDEYLIQYVGNYSDIQKD